MTVWKCLKLEISIGLFGFWENLRRSNLLTVLSQLKSNLIDSGNLIVELEAISHPMARKGFEMSRISFDAKIS